VAPAEDDNVTDEIALVAALNDNLGPTSPGVMLSNTGTPVAEVVRHRKKANTKRVRHNQSGGALH
jgi:hypothetical protein